MKVTFLMSFTINVQLSLNINSFKKAITEKNIAGFIHSPVSIPTNAMLINEKNKNRKNFFSFVFIF